MKQRQRLSSGLWIEQDLNAAVRPIFYQTDWEEFLYATHGGTLFIVTYKGRPYALTCRHVFGDFEFERLFIGPDKNAQKGQRPARLRGQIYPSSPRDGAVGSDVMDLCVIEFDDGVNQSFFNGSAYIIDANTIASSKPNDRLRVFGVLKEKTRIELPDIEMGYCTLEFGDMGLGGSDAVIRMAKAKYQHPQFTTLTGISGAPVLNESRNALCGMVMRGGMTGDGCCTIYYIDVTDIAAFLEGNHHRASNLEYTKNVPSSGSHGATGAPV